MGRGALAPPRVILKEPGLILDGFIQNIPNVYPGVIVDKYVIMPNHVHLLIQITREEDGGARAPRPTGIWPHKDRRGPVWMVPAYSTSFFSGIQSRASWIYWSQKVQK